MKRNTPLWALMVSAGVLAGFLGWPLMEPIATAQQPKATDADSKPKVNVVKPAALKAEPTLQFNAKLAPLQEASLYARSSGFVEAVHVDIGSTVKAGQLLALISAPELQSNVLRAQATVKQREAELLVATKNRERAQPLSKQGAVSPQELDALLATEQVSQANLKAAQAELARLQTELAYLRVVAPFEGVVTDRLVQKGDRVSSTDTRMLFRLVNAQVLRVQVDVPQPQYFRVNTQAEAQITLAEQPGTPFQAQFKRASGEVRSDTGTVRLEYELNNRKLQLPAGLSAQVRLSTRSQGQGLTVPANTIVYRDGVAQVMTVDAQGVLAYKKVSLGKNLSTAVEVLSGVGPQDQLVVNPNALLKPGQVVTVQSPPS